MSEENPYNECRRPEDVDEVTKTRIGLIFGGLDDEFKMHREAILSMATLIWGVQSKNLTTEKAREKVRELLIKNQEIEKIIEEGKKVKRGMGWQ